MILKNSRLIKKNDLTLKLTEREIEIIIFLKNSFKPQNIENLQKKVWGHNSELETHTVETHIYRLRKKISKVFNDENFKLEKMDSPLELIYQVKLIQNLIRLSSKEFQ